MTRGRRQALLGLHAAAVAVLLIAFLMNLDLTREPQRPSDVEALARWIAAHPADWLAASALTAEALDADVPRRVELWRGAYAHARALAPRRPNAAAAFVAGGLSHWYELGPADRGAVLAAAAPLLSQDPALFSRLHRSLWLLTRDLGWLRRNAPRTDRALGALRDLAVTSGRFADYRELREEVRQARLAHFQAIRATATADELLGLVPPRLDRRDASLVRGILEELERRPLELEKLDGRVQRLRAFASDGVVPADEPGGWTGGCGRDEICTSASRTHDGPLRIKLSVVQSDEVPPYVEIYTDNALVAEGEVKDQQTFEVGAGPGRHRTEVRVANPKTRNQVQRRLRIWSAAAKLPL